MSREAAADLQVGDCVGNVNHREGDHDYEGHGPVAGVDLDQGEEDARRLLEDCVSIKRWIPSRAYQGRTKTHKD